MPPSRIKFAKQDPPCADGSPSASQAASPSVDETPSASPRMPVGALGSVTPFTLFKAPRLIVDWTNVSVHHSPHMVSQEMFFNCTFAMLLGILRGGLVQNQDLWYFTRRFVILWSFVNNAADYATRFNDDDLWHIVLWGGYGLGLAATMMHMNTNEGFHYSVAFTKIVVAVAWLRVAIYLPRARAFAMIYGGSLIGSAFICASCGHGSAILGLYPLFAQPAVTILTNYILPHSVGIPMNISYHLPKFDGFFMLVLGQLVGAAATPPRPGGPADFTGFYASALSAVFLLISFKLICSDCLAAATLQPYHALAAAPGSGLAWLLVCQPGKAYAVVVCAAGVSFVLSGRNGTGTPKTEAFGVALTCYASSALFALALFEGKQHALEPIAKGLPDLRFWRGAMTRALAIASAVCALVPSLAARLPQLRAAVLPIVALLALSAASIGLVYKTHLGHARVTGPHRFGVEMDDDDKKAD